jgi:UDP-GlcNAc:undecaprenyl-phosphate GlcNAc-1-phosphate transferase
VAELLFLLEASIVSFALTGVILRFSLGRSLLDIPNDRSSHKVPKPRLGGIAITAAFFVTIVTMFASGFDPFPEGTSAAGILGGGVLLALMGLLDDIRGLDARLKLMLQLTAAGIVVASGITLTELKLPLAGVLPLGQLAVPFTILWIVSIINFYNFIDGIDGLAAGVGMIAALFLVLITTMAGFPAMALPYLALAGSCLGFLRFNFPPAKIFMGDMGSTFIGYGFAVLSVVGASRGVPAFITPLLLGAVIGDAALTLGKRIIGRERIFIPHRTHYYQRLTSIGLSHKQVTLLEYLVTALLGVSAILAFRGERMFVTFFSVMWTGFFLWALVKIRSMERGGRLFWEGGTVAVALGDVVFITASYILSYYFRLNFQLREAEFSVMLVSLPIVIVIRTAVFYYYGLYRSVWRYTTFDDVIRIVKAVSVGSAVMIVSFTLLFRFIAFPRSVFLIDWFVLTVFIGGARIATRWFHELPSHEEVTAKRVVVGGTGPAAEAILHKIKRAGGLSPVGCLDDRVEMRGKIIHGLEVLGPYSEISRIVMDHRIEELFVASPYQSRIPQHARAELEERGVRVHFVADTSSIADLQDLEAAESPCRNERILVAGNGGLIEVAHSVFREANEVVILSDSVRTLEASIRHSRGDGPRRITYLGLLEEGRAVRSILEKHEPSCVIAHFRFNGLDLSNEVEAYLRKVLLPVYRLASASRERRAARFVLVHPGPGSDSDSHGEALESLAGSIIGEDADRLLVLRTDLERPVGWWTNVLGDLLKREGGVYAVVRHREGTLRYNRQDSIIERIGPVLPAPEAENLVMRLSRSLDERDEPAMAAALEDLRRIHAEKTHE